MSDDDMLSDSRPVTLERVWLTLQHQADTMKRIEVMMQDKASNHSDLERRTTTVHTQLAIHKVILYIAGTLILTFMPIMVSWNFALRSELQLLHSTTDTLSEKTRTLERVTYKIPSEGKGG